MLMQRVADRMPARGVMMDRYLAGKLPRLDAAPIEKDETWGEKVRGQFTVTKYFTGPRPRRSSRSRPTCSIRCGATTTPPAATSRCRASC